MTVVELIKKLSEYPGDKLVNIEVISTFGAHSWSAQHVSEQEVENGVTEIFIS
jgi:hypothetical protein